MPFLWLLLFIFSLIIQSSGQIIYSLQDIFEIANNNANRLKIIENESQTSLQQVQIYRSEAFPKIDFSSGFGYANQTLQADISLPGEINSLLDRIDGVVVNWSLSIEQPVFRFGQIRNALKLASLSKKLSAKTGELQKNLYYLQVVEQFTLAYISQFDYLISRRSIEISNRNLQRITVDFQSSHASRLDLLRAEALLESDKAQLITSESNNKLSIKSLNTLIGLPDSHYYQLILDTSGSFFKIPANVNQQGNEILIKKLELEINEKLRRNAWSSFFPSLNLTGSIYNEFMAVDTSGFAELMSSFPGSEEGFTEIPVSSDFFNPDLINYSIGIQLRWNAFDGLANRAQYRMAKYQEEKTRLELEQLERETNTDIRQISDQIASIENSISAYSLQLEASVKALQQADMDFKDGFIDMISYIDIQKEYQNAERSLNSAKLQRIMLIAQLRIALGLNVYSK